MAIRIGIVTVSDRASKGVYQDLGGPAIRECLAEILSCPWEPVPRLIPDERPVIEESLKELCDREGCLFAPAAWAEFARSMSASMCRSVSMGCGRYGYSR